MNCFKPNFQKSFYIIVCIYFVSYSFLYTNPKNLSANPLILKEKTSLICKVSDDDSIYPSTLKTNYPIADSVAFAFKTNRGKSGYAISLNGKNGPLFDNISILGPVFSPDGRRLAYIAVKGKEVYSVIDGKKSDAYESIAEISFSPDSSKIVFLARDINKKYFAVTDGKKGINYDGIRGEGYPVFSPDSSKVVYLAYKNKKWAIVVNDKELKIYDDIKGPVFSPDSKHFSYMAKSNNTWVSVIDGVPGIPFDDI